MCLGRKEDLKKLIKMRKHMRVIRCFHPVGHGAFFSEQFFDSEESCFNVVYDCGIKHFPMNRLQEEADFAIGKSGRQHVDFLFISHLDEDHVNGIKYLIKQKYVDDQTSFVLPLYKDYHLKIYEHFEGKSILSIFEVIGKTESKSIFYVPLTESEDDDRRGDDENGQSRINMEEGLPETSENKVEVNGLPGRVIPRGSVFTFKEIWEYIPFNLHDSTSEDFFKAIDNSKILNIADMLDVEAIFKNKCHHITKKSTAEQIDATKKYRELKRIYNSVGKIVKGDRRININSLAVISQAVNEVKVRIAFVDLEEMIAEGYFRNYCYGHIIQGYGACTYTGDLNLSQDADFDLFEKKVKKALRGETRYHLLQIPHHGSNTSYNKRFCGGLSRVCFVNFNSEKGIFDEKIAFDFFCARKTLIPVTEIESSRYVWECWV